MHEDVHCCCCSVAKSCLTVCNPMDCSTCTPCPLSSTIFQSLPKFMSIESMMLSNHLILCHPILLLHSIFPSIRVFSNELTLCIRWPKYRSFSISPSNGYSGLISFRINWYNLLVVQGTLQHQNSKASILQHSPFLWSKSHICV